jgi:putative membrane protein
MKHWMTASALTLFLAACGGGGEPQANQTTGQPETDTTGSAQSIQQTGTASATTTGVTGGLVSAATPDDKTFVAKAGMAGLYEVQAGNLALQKAESAGVRAFAQRMIADHGKANAELAQLATVKGLALPAELEGEHEAAVEHLNTLSGAEFDKAYMDHMRGDHQKDVAEFEKAAASAQDADIKAFAAKTLPVLREHLQLAQQTK